MADPKFECPIDCPHQADDSILTAYGSWLSRYRLFFLVTIAVGLMSYSIVLQEKRRPTNTEFLGGLILVIVSLEKPTALAELALKQLDKSGDKEGNS